MSSTELRSRRTKADLPASDEVLETIALQGPEITTLIEEPTENLGIISLAKKNFYNKVFFPFWNHLDERGFGTPQPFICWLLLPFTLSMIVWYYSVIELMDLADWESKMGPMPTYPEVDDFKWGEL